MDIQLMAYPPIVRRLVLCLGMLGVSALLLGVTGCTEEGPPIFQVTGRVTHDGEPVGQGVVLFIDDQGFGTSANLRADGTFELASHHGGGIPLGEYHVAITPPDDDYDYDAPEAAGSAEDFPNIPSRYQDVSTSDLTFTITEGENHFEIELSD